MKINILVLLFALISNYAFSSEASTIRYATCPNVNLDATTIINKINTLASQLKTSESDYCSSLSEKILSLNDIINNQTWKDAKNSLKGNNLANLEGSQIESLSGLTEKASSLLSETISSLASDESCLPKKNKESFLANMSTVVREVSSTAGNISGPYGFAVNLGGSLLSGAISGIDKILSKNRFKFKDHEQELLFLNQYCAYAEIQKDISDFISTPNRLDEIDLLEKYLHVKIKDLRDNCVECDAYYLAHMQRKKIERIEHKIISSANLIPLGDDQNSKTYTRCKEIHRFIHTDTSPLAELISLYENYENPLLSNSNKELIEDIVLASKEFQKSQERFPKLSKCIMLPLKQKVKISMEFNSLIRDEILPLKDEVFTFHMNTLLYVMDVKKYKDPLGEYTSNSIARVRWMEHQRNENRTKIKDPNFEISVGKIIETNEKLKRRINERFLPQYFKFLLRSNKRGITNLKQAISKYSRQNNIFTNNNNSSLKNSLLKKVHLSLEKEMSKTKLIQRLCLFDQYMLNSSPKKYKYCKQAISKLKSRYKSLSKQYPKLPIEVDRLFKKEKIESYQSSRVSEFSNLIQNWNQRGDSRWCLKREVYKAQNTQQPNYCKTEN
ncbi:hypothetical protein N9N67_04830 [Bacteriovoracaceae bacterium]|nr:hypothetical protein [Bacteriovoracaceae bacterium]